MQSQSLSSASSAVQNVTTNVVHHYQNQQQVSGHYTPYDQSPVPSTFNQHLAGTSSTAMHSLSVTSEIQHEDSGRVVISAPPKQQIQSEPTFVSPSTSVHVRRVVHSEAYIR